MLEDPDDGEDRMRRNPSTAARSNRIRRARAGTETTVEPDEDEQQSNGDFVIRDKSGNYLREVPMIGEADADVEEERKSSLQYYLPSNPYDESKDCIEFRVTGLWLILLSPERAEDVRLTAITRDFWTSGAGLSGGRGSRRLDEEGLSHPSFAPLLV